MSTETPGCSRVPSLWYILVGLIPMMLLAVCAGAYSGGSMGKEWLSADTGLGPGEPDSRAVVSTLDSTILNIDVPGAYLEEVESSGGRYHRIGIPGAQSVALDGQPELPELVLLVASPEFEAVAIEHSVGAIQSFDDVELLPCPAESETHEARGTSEEVARILRVGRIRDQKVIWVGVRPVRYDSVNRRLLVHSKLRVALHYTEPNPGLALWGTGPFDGICKRLLLGYKENQTTPVVPLLSSGGGQVAWVSSLDSCVANNTDYNYRKLVLLS